MIIVLKQNVEADRQEQLIDWFKGLGLGVHVSDGQYQTVLGLVGDTSKVDSDLVASLDIVDSVKRVTETFKCCNRKFHPEDTVVNVKGVQIGAGNFAMIAGPCSVESEEQIVEIAKALSQDVKILIMDEPTVGLDPKERVHFRELVERVSKDKIVIIATHIVSDLEKLASEIIFLNHGKIVESGTLQELYEKYRGEGEPSVEKIYMSLGMESK